MKTYCLKDKILVTKVFLKDLADKSWQEIEYIQSQLVNIEDNKENSTLIKLLQNLLTSYYVFTGGIENLLDAAGNTEALEMQTNVVATADEQETITQQTPDEITLVTKKADSEQVLLYDDNDVETVIEPFEYFVDFEEPSGEPITDEDLYS